MLRGWHHGSRRGFAGMASVAGSRSRTAPWLSRLGRASLVLVPFALIFGLLSKGASRTFLRDELYEERVSSTGRHSRELRMRRVRRDLAEMRMLLPVMGATELANRLASVRALGMLDWEGFDPTWTDLECQDSLRDDPVVDTVLHAVLKEESDRDMQRMEVEERRRFHQFVEGERMDAEQQEELNKDGGFGKFGLRSIGWGAGSGDVSFLWQPVRDMRRPGVYPPLTPEQATPGVLCSGFRLSPPYRPGLSSPWAPEGNQ